MTEFFVTVAWYVGLAAGMYVVSMAAKKVIGFFHKKEQA